MEKEREQREKRSEGRRRLVWQQHLMDGGGEVHKRTREGIGTSVGKCMSETEAQPFLSVHGKIGLQAWVPGPLRFHTPRILMSHIKWNSIFM
jgi:hypothetical protein